MIFLWSWTTLPIANKIHNGNNAQTELLGEMCAENLWASRKSNPVNAEIKHILV
jgi:hypothetical protein